MKRDAFKTFVESTLEAVIRLAEESADTKLERRYCFRWTFQTDPPVYTDVSEHLTKRLFIDEDHIYLR